MRASKVSSALLQPINDEAKMMECSNKLAVHNSQKKSKNKKKRDAKFEVAEVCAQMLQTVVLVSLLPVLGGPDATVL